MNVRDAGRPAGGRVVRGLLAPPFALVSLLALTLSLTVAAAGDGVLPGDVAVARAVQRIEGPGLGDLVRLVNEAGEAPATVALTTSVVLALGFARRHPEALLVLATFLARAVNPLLKTLAQSPRPTADAARITEYAGGLGFPSGHVMGAVLFYGVLIYLSVRLISRPAARLPLQGLAGGMIVLMGFSRVYTGAHWPSDVLGGYLWGAVILAAVLLLFQTVRNRLHALTS